MSALGERPQAPDDAPEHGGPEHGGGIDAAAARWGGRRSEWLDLSTGINPVPYPLPVFNPDDWTALPDTGARDRLIGAARSFWRVPADAAITAAPGVSALIARLPGLMPVGRVSIPGPTYSEYAAAFRAQAWTVCDHDSPVRNPVRVIVHPNNPDGHLWTNVTPAGQLLVIDESFCDVAPERSWIGLAAKPGVVVLKSLGKFWGLAGVRLGFAIGAPALVARLSRALGPWPVAGPALRVGTLALMDTAWAQTTRARLARDAARLDALVGWPVVGGTSLFRLYDAGHGNRVQARLARSRIWVRTFAAHNKGWVRLGLPGDGRAWARLAAAL